MPYLAPLVAVAHGSKDPRAAATVTSLLAVTRDRAAERGWPELNVVAAFLDHSAPSLPQVLGSVADGDGCADGADGDRSCVVVPLLLTAAYHSKTDIPSQIAAAGGAAGLDVVRAHPLGPHPLLLAALERRLAEAGEPVTDPAARAATSVVLAAAGSSDPAANATIAELAAAWQRLAGWRAVIPAYASAGGPTPADAVRTLRAAAAGPGRVPDRVPDRVPNRVPNRVIVATYLLSPGYFADKIYAMAVAGGADAVSSVLGAAPEVADVILDRYAAAWDSADRGPEGRACPAAPGSRSSVPNRLLPEPSFAQRYVAATQLACSSIRGNRRGTDLHARATPRRE
jgi:sirohydrochlorin ferrochelatase